MIFYEKSGKELKEAQELCTDTKIIYEDVKDIIDIEKLKETKPDTKITINNTELLLTDTYFKYVQLFNLFWGRLLDRYERYIRIIDIKETGKKHDLSSYDKIFEEETKNMIGTYLLYTDYDKEKVLRFYKEAVLIKLNFIKRLAEKQQSLEEEIKKATSELERDYEKARNKAVGSELGWFYGTDTYAGAALGTWLTSATLESDSQKAQDSYKRKLSYISSDRDSSITIGMKFTLQELVGKYLEIIFEDEIKSFNHFEIYRAFFSIINSTNKEKIELFNKYPFLYVEYDELINVIDEQEYDKLIEIINYYDIKKEAIISIRESLYKKYANYLEKNKDNSSYNTKEIKFLSKLNNKDSKSCISEVLNKYFENEIFNNKYYSPLEDSNKIAIKINKVKDLLDKKDYDKLLEYLGKKKDIESIGKEKKFSVDDYNPVGGAIFAFIAYFVLFAMTGEYGIKQIIISIIFGGGVYLAYIFTDKYLIKKFGNDYSKPNLLKWFTSEYEFKRKCLLTLIIYIVFIVLLVLYSSLSSKSVDIYKANSWHSREKNTYISFNKDGTVSLMEDGEGEKYKCEITQGDIDIEKGKSKKRNGHMNCKINNNNAYILFTISSYNDMKNTFLDLKCVDSKSDKCPNWAVGDEGKFVIYLKDNAKFKVVG